MTDNTTIEQPIHGATNTLWLFFEQEVGAENIVPIAQHAEGIASTLPAAVIGKVPSQFNQAGAIVGYHDWQTGRAKPTDLQRWQKDGRYGFGVRLGFPLPTGGIAVCVDVDTENDESQNIIHQLIMAKTGGPVAMRVRANSNRRAYMLRVLTENVITKRVLPLRKADKAAGIKGEAIEFLANGQQFAAFGRHPSGANIEWLDAPAQDLSAGSLLPELVNHTLSEEDFNELQRQIAEAFSLELAAFEEGRARHGKTDIGDCEISDPVAEYLDAENWTLSIGSEGQRHIRSPFEDEYTTEQDDNDTSVTYFCAGTRGYEQGHFVSQHASDSERTDTDFLEATGYAAAQFPDLPELEPQAPVPKGAPYLSGLKAGRWLMEDERDRLRAMNDAYVHTTAGGKNVICKIGRRSLNDTVVQDLQFIRIPELKDRFVSTNPVYGYLMDAEGNKLKGKAINLADAWLAWPSHLQKFGGVDFYPNPAKCPKDTYNLFTGWNVAAVPGDVSPYLDLVERCICGGNKAHTDYVLDYLAHMFQRPEQKPSVAIVMRGARGIGKGSFMRPIGQMLGVHYAQLTGAGQAAGRFNAVMVGKLAVFLDELRVTSRDAEDALKMIISEPVISIERKGIDPETYSNFSRVIGASNHQDVIRTGANERRYLLLDSSDVMAQNPEYWKGFYNWLNAGGAQHLLAYLLERDISNFDPFNCPRSEALQAAMVQDLPPIDRFVLEQLRRTAPFDVITGDGGEDAPQLGYMATPNDPADYVKGGEIVTEDVALLLLNWLAENHPKRSGQPWNIDHARQGLRVLFNKVFDIRATGRKGAGYGRVYEVEDFDILRDQFAEYVGVDYAAAFDAAARFE